MPGPIPRCTPEQAVDEDCRQVEATVTRLATIALHASVLADRSDAAAASDTSMAARRREHVRVLRAAADAAREAILRVGLATGLDRGP